MSNKTQDAQACLLKEWLSYYSGSKAKSKVPLGSRNEKSKHLFIQQTFIVFLLYMGFAFVFSSFPRREEEIEILYSGL